MTSPRDDVTALLLDWSGGDGEALERLLPILYQELHQLARGYFSREDSGHTLQPTALVHEVYLRLVDQKRVHWQNRAHFLGVAAQMMRRILVDHARRRKASKRGGGAKNLALDEALDQPGEAQVDYLALDEALDRLAAFDPAQSRLVELRFFAGLTVKETAEVLSISPATVKREWSVARAWLYRQMNAG